METALLCIQNEIHLSLFKGTLFKCKINPEKTEFIVFGSMGKCKCLKDSFPVNILRNCLSPTDVIHNLGVWFDCKFSFTNHVNSVIVSTGCYDIYLWISLCYAATMSQCVERLHHYRSNEKTNIIASLLKFAGYIHNHKVLPGNIFGLILKNKMAVMGVFATFSKDFCWPSRTKGIIARDLKFGGYVPHYKILTGNIFGLILKKQDGHHGPFFVSHEKVLISPLLLVLEVWDGKPTDRKSWAGNLLVWSDLT